MSSVQSSPFGHQLRSWRQRRGLSQMDLALSANSTPRYVSFLETGRSRPRREIVLRLASALSVPLRERNTMLVAAGLPAEYPVQSLAEQGNKPVGRVISALMQSHEPFPAWCMTREWRVISANDGGNRMLPGMTEMSPEQLIDLWFGPGPMRDMVENWAELLYAGLSALQRDAMHFPSEQIEALLARARGHARDVPVPPPNDEMAVICPIFIINGQRISTVSTQMRFDTACEVTASELKVDLMFPADADSEAFFRNQGFHSD